MNLGLRSICVIVAVILIVHFYRSVLLAADGAVGDFEAQVDVGKVDPPGTAEFDKAAAQYKVTSSGENMWKAHDDFHFVYRKVSGDLVLTADVAFVGESKSAHRKGGWMIRQNLEADAPYVDVMVHGDGLIALQYRSEKGAETMDLKSPIKAPATVRLERRGETFTLLVAPKEENKDKAPAFVSAGSVKVALADQVYAGLAVCSHDPKTVETVIFSGVTLKNEK